MKPFRAISKYLSASLLAVLCVLCGCDLVKHSSKLSEQSAFYIIPSDWIELRVKEELKNYSAKRKTMYSPVRISEMISLGEYKRYIEALGHDSAEYYVTSQLPKPEFTSKELIDEYITNRIYENEPVIGVSWENALHYCAWRTHLEQGDTLNFIYRLPTSWEWKMADTYAQAELRSHDFDATLSNWLIESRYPYTSDDELKKKGNIYWHRQDDSPAEKRKVIAGNSYQYRFKNPNEINDLNYFGNKGYKQIAFRIVKDYNLEAGSFADQVINYWEVMP